MFASPSTSTAQSQSTSVSESHPPSALVQESSSSSWLSPIGGLGDNSALPTSNGASYDLFARPASSLSLHPSNLFSENLKLAQLSQPPLRPASHPNLNTTSSPSLPNHSHPHSQSNGFGPSVNGFSSSSSSDTHRTTFPLPRRPSNSPTPTSHLSHLHPHVSSPSPLARPPSHPMIPSQPQQPPTTEGADNVPSPGPSQTTMGRQVQPIEHKIFLEYLRQQGIDQAVWNGMSVQDKEHHKAGIAALNAKLRGMAAVSAGNNKNQSKQAQMLLLRKIAIDHVKRHFGIEKVTVGPENKEIDIGVLYFLVFHLGGGSMAMTKSNGWLNVCGWLQLPKDDIHVKGLIEVYGKYLSTLEKSHSSVRRSTVDTPSPSTPNLSTVPPPPIPPPSTSSTVLPGPSSPPASAVTPSLTLPLPSQAEDTVKEPQVLTDESLPPTAVINATSSPSVNALQIKTPLAVASSPQTAKRPSPTIDLEQSNVATTEKDEEPITRPKKRYRISYAPIIHTTACIGDWDLRALDSVYNRFRPAKLSTMQDDLGLVDVHGLIMSLKSRMGHEVAFALNTLTTLCMSMGIEGSLPFPLHQCDDLGEEVLELLEECLGEGSQAGGGQEAWRGKSYQRVKRMAEEETARLLPLPDEKSKASTSRAGPSTLGRTEIILAILNFLRNVTAAEDVAKFCVNLPRFAELILRPCLLTSARFTLAKRGKTVGAGIDSDVKISLTDLLTIRKDVAIILSNVGLDMELASYKGWVAEGIVELLTWFLDGSNEVDAGAYGDPWTMRGKDVVSHIHRFSYTTEIALLALAKVSTRDPNREVFCAVLDSQKIEVIIDKLKLFLPYTEESINMIAHFESGIVTLELLTIAIYNFIVLCKPTLKRKLSLKTDLVKSLFNIVHKLLPKFPDQGSTGVSKDIHYKYPICQRCLDILRTINESITESSSSLSGKHDQEEDSNVWFGGGFMDDDAEEETIFKADKETPSLLAGDISVISWINVHKQPPTIAFNDLQNLCYSRR